MRVNDNLTLGVGDVSMTSKLGGYYQDFKPAIYHFENDSLGKTDENGIPHLIIDDKPYYSIVMVMQYALIQFEFIAKDGRTDERTSIIKNCLNWLDDKAEVFKDSVVWRSEANAQYKLPKGWTSGMYQGQAASLYLRAYQLFDNKDYLATAYKAIEYLKYDYADGGVRRTDENGYMWLEEYPTDPPSYVLNGFIYGLFGALDLYRVTGHEPAKELFDEGVKTLENNLYKYDRWYWSAYDQGKKELVSYYYQKNVHTPLMEIMYLITKEEIFQKYHIKWKGQLNSGFKRLIVKVMYRVQPRIKKLFK